MAYSLVQRALVIVLIVALGTSVERAHAEDSLPSWNDGAARRAIVDFVKTTTDRSSSNFIAPEGRVATFDQDGTLWVEHPMYSQVVYCLERVPALVKEKPELGDVEPFRTVLSGNREAIAALPMPQLEKILAATLTGMTVDDFKAEAERWIATAKDARWTRPYTGADQQAGYISATSEHCAELTCDQQPDHTFGSKADIERVATNVRYGPEADVVARHAACLLWANSGRRRCSLHGPLRANSGHRPAKRPQRKPQDLVLGR